MVAAVLYAHGSQEPLAVIDLPRDALDDRPLIIEDHNFVLRCNDGMWVLASTDIEASQYLRKLYLTGKHPSVSSPERDAFLTALAAAL